MEDIRRLAQVSVGRACAFASLAILLLMVGLSGYPLIALKTGAVCLMATAGVLIFKAERSPRRPYKATELWSLLEPERRPIPPVAQKVIGTTLKDTFVRFAVWFAVAGMGCFAAAGVTQALRVITGVA
jgi:hypothetical protein